ncbi:MAG: ABC transporter ATP-binding protein [bacterium]|nr:ABC transporter ATP-binding protein [bacterium]
MTEIAIRAAGLSKQYRIGEREPYKTLRDTLAAIGTAPWRAARRVLSRSPGDGRRRRDSTVWALRDVSLEVGQGEVVGIIGRNGAGKTTLLKILARITEPTEGWADVLGRVGSLLEVGSGFHPELTGRENVYLYGAIMGMKRSEIRSKFDEIVAFAEIGKFVDTPVKRYSSGMYMRLAFSVAAHLEPEVLVVDEVLAVGDAKFQKKCLGKMGEVAREGGRTVLFVSHNMDAVRRLCQRAIWLDQGRVLEIGEAAYCIARYMMSGVADEGRVVFVPPHALGGGLPVRLHSAQVTTADGSSLPVYSAASSLRVRIEWENSQPLWRPRIGFVLQTPEGVDVLTSLDAAAGQEPELRPGRRVSTCVLPGQLLNEGQYVIDVGGDGQSEVGDTRRPHSFMRSRTGPVVQFEIEDDTTLPSKHYGQHGIRDTRWPGVLLMNLPWDHQARGPEGPNE